MPLFTISVGDPQKVGDPIKAHIVYTVTTFVSAPLDLSFIHSFVFSLRFVSADNIRGL
jgi:hypothetical protein